MSAAAFFDENGLTGEVARHGRSGLARRPRTGSPPPDPPPRKERQGAAVRRGVLESRGEIVIYADSSACAVPYANALPVIARIRAEDV